MGCYKDNATINPDFNETLIQNNQMSIQYCNLFCRARNYFFSSNQNG